MNPAVVVGGSLAGLASALALAGRGHEVVVLERDAPPPEGPPGEIALQWMRPSAPQALHSHTLTSLGVAVLRARAPHVLEAARAEGAVLLDMIDAMPPAARVPADDELVALACRRNVIDLVLHRIVRAMPGVQIRHGVRVRGLELGRGRATGVFLEDGEKVAAKFVVDATGRRAEARAWLAAADIDLAPDLSSPSGVRCYSRFFRRRGPRGPLNRGNSASILADYCGVLHPGDGDTFSVAFGVLPGDETMRALRHPEGFAAAVHLTPCVSAWFEGIAPEPLSEIRAITCPANVLRTLAIAPPVEGLYAVGDAACITNPLSGRGMSLAFAHAFRLADCLDTAPENAPRVARDLYLPWYEQATEEDADRIARWRAAMVGASPPPRPRHLTMSTVGPAASRDADIWRALTRVRMTLQPPAEIFSSPQFEDRVRQALPHAVPPARMPTRGDLVTSIQRGR